MEHKLGRFFGSTVRWQDLGTLGTGNDAIAGLINEHGQIAGISYTTATANPATGIPTLDPFFWENGKMVDIGSLGGATGLTTAINNRGEVIGVSSVAASPGACLFKGEGDPNCHPFLWDRGELIDLNTGTLGGNPLIAYGINDAGEVVGIGTFPNAPADAYLWRKGVATGLGHLSDCASFANAINSHSQVVGGTFSCHGTHARAFLWEKGSMIDLNSVIPANSPLQLVVAYGINNRGEIVGEGVPPGVPPANDSSQGHAFLLIPCDKNHGDSECEDEGKGTAATIQNTPAPVDRTPTNVNHGTLTSETLVALRARLAHRYHTPGLGTPRD